MKNTLIMSLLLMVAGCSSAPKTFDYSKETMCDFETHRLKVSDEAGLICKGDYSKSKMAELYRSSKNVDQCFRYECEPIEKPPMPSSQDPFEELWKTLKTSTPKPVCKWSGDLKFKRTYNLIRHEFMFSKDEIESLKRSTPSKCKYLQVTTEQSEFKDN